MKEASRERKKANKGRKQSTKEASKQGTEFPVWRNASLTFIQGIMPAVSLHRGPSHLSACRKGKEHVT
eukprot:scaffold60931_cov24-Tisochrysis_lutea.AAC.1